MNAFLNTLNDYEVKENILKREKLTTLQVNLGDLCNQSCRHCHIEASSQGRNIMTKKVIQDILKFITRYRIKTLDITGGAPELNPNFNYLIQSAKPEVEEIIVRSNLTVFFEKDKDYLPNFFKEYKVHLICSLPCYTKENVDYQRGNEVFAKSIRALCILNDLGFGKGNGLKLDLAHNPIGPNLPLEQAQLEKDYKINLYKEYGIVFNRLISLTNAPINRFSKDLETHKEYDKYLSLLKSNFNVGTLENLMCRSLLSVGFDGKIYDCDFNLALGLYLKDKNERIITIDNVKPDELAGKQIIFGEHCFSCTAGRGSSCQGALALHSDLEIRDKVKDFYIQAAKEPQKQLCCPMVYEKEDISYIPQEVLEVSYGCGSPMSQAKPKQGEVVVDLGSGAGIDCFIAAKKVGITGKVIGIDMTEEMLNKANLATEEVARNLGFLNCEFRKGFLEDIPVETASVDLVTSNCVINLSPDKSRVFAEIYRILKDKARFVISDIVSDKQVPLYMKEDQRLWGECISGALTQNKFLTKAQEAGFYGLEILKNFKYKEIEGIQFCSITVRGYKLKKNKDCVYIGQYATYLGPYSEVRDDDGHIFPRGIPIEVCTDTAKKLMIQPYVGHFIITDIQKDGKPNSCCSQGEEKPCC